MALVLFGTEACHLCELAQAVIVDVAGQIALDVYVEDIAEADTLVERYGSRIPVLLNEQTGAELDWPFDKVQLLNWLQGRTQAESISE